MMRMYQDSRQKSTAFASVRDANLAGFASFECRLANLVIPRRNRQGDGKVL